MDFMLRKQRSSRQRDEWGAVERRVGSTDCCVLWTVECCGWSVDFYFVDFSIYTYTLKLHVT